MVASISQKSQEIVCCPTAESIGIYDRLANIIRRSKSQSMTPEASFTKRKIHQQSVAQQVNEQKDKTISQSLLIFGTIHR